MGITKRQIRYDEKGRRLPVKYRLLEIDGLYYIARNKGILDLVEERSMIKSRFPREMDILNEKQEIKK